MNQTKLIKLYEKYLDCFDFYSGKREISKFTSFEEVDQILLDYSIDHDLEHKIESFGQNSIYSKLQILAYKNILNAQEFELFIKHLMLEKEYYLKKKIRIIPDEYYLIFVNNFTNISQSNFLNSNCNFETLISIVNYLDLQKPYQDTYLFRSKELTNIEVMKLILVSNQVGISYPISYTDLADYYLKLKREFKVDDIDEYIIFFEDLFKAGKDSIIDIIKKNLEKKAYYYPNFEGDIAKPIEGEVILDEYWKNRLTLLLNQIDQQLA